MITGKEPIGRNVGHEGETLYQRTLREFMSAIITGGLSNPRISQMLPEDVAGDAKMFTDAYINQLNQQQTQ